MRSLTHSHLLPFYGFRRRENRADFFDLSSDVTFLSFPSLLSVFSKPMYKFLTPFFSFLRHPTSQSSDRSNSVWSRHGIQCSSEVFIPSLGRRAARWN